MVDNTHVEDSNALIFFLSRSLKKKITSNVERELEMTTYPFEACNFINITYYHGYLLKKKILLPCNYRRFENQ